MTHQTDDLRIKGIQEVSAPDVVRDEIPLTEAAAETVFASRQAIHRILHREDDRLLVIVGPCSIHDVDAAMDYADRLVRLRGELNDALEVVMRVYFEKPRTTVGWKGLINDPDLDGSFHINKGLRVARGLLRDLAVLGMPAATEYLDLISPQYVADLVAWGAIGARTTESQVHRELASGLSCPVGFKNSTDGSLQVAIDAIRSASRPHHFLSVTKAGRSAIFSTAGNEDCHIILRGGRQPNYDAESIEQACQQLRAAELPEVVMVDCSHANSRKDPARQIDVARSLAEQVGGGNTHIIGVMLESHLKPGRQDIVPGRPLVYGQSITDACMGWDDSGAALQLLAEAVRRRRQAR
ncbi:2-keto-3-deoxy-D-arabino-heptulosonate-7- phosphate synthase I alpha [Thioalkalivibrio nitratireducens DSM 14787]|uniref:Phospho-2-dehydro-3-deoxyheptonate aldolase n=1 Tax=Thioalkalivibrio nitratireducens (strain DSM 14787 / UNIQEM 213 / ALEN2) TaxID=1255043 RepID=L0DYZ2_THIND|nr:3-deoxy-7-phosphoheptulonate synthase [Thioalkalivibrio nitratireducens]AGA34268.1 2-keto-3-deoxy-D-arabino-heptulosonate-7- phosphate synthase I alpha [Thioalkalivibrio nitratireducens DSM 14787]